MKRIILPVCTLLLPLTLLAQSVALSVDSASQGVTFNGNTIGANRSNPDFAIDSAPDNDFFSLGFHPMGWMIFELETTVSAGELTIWETTWTSGNYCLETADLYVGDASMTEWVYIGTADNERGANSDFHETTLIFDDSVGMCVKYIKLVHTTTDSEAVNSCPTGDGFDVDAVFLLGSGLSCAESSVFAAEEPREFKLSPNSPNPFNPATQLRFELENTGMTKLQVFDLKGRLVASLLDGMMEAGVHEVSFNGASLPSGVYIYRLDHDGASEARKMILSK